MLIDDQPTFTFTLLGPVQAWHRGAETDLGSPQQRTTLAMLLLREGSAVTLDELIANMWGSEPPRSAATTIRTYVSRLRAIFIPADPAQATRIDSVGGGYVLHTPRQGVDLFRFSRHTASAADAARRLNWREVAAAQQQAVDAAAGQPLAGAIGPYMQAQRSRLQQLVTAARLDLMHALLRQGRHREVLPELTTMVAEHPLWEEVQALYMTALAGSGRIAEALEHYRTARRDLVEQLGIEPGTQLRRAHQQILDNNVATATPPGRVMTRQRQRRHQMRLVRHRTAS
ncbi:BTAD domain-containing putative transcriptional regulator [Micromonospora andamanensis]|uniref:OmpR/PhoB-type domain-containing protein n=1 Tax=Micromonospora andamanensis TaxID=1287068 RepID=A0ABQ4I305_9ACTN|nr:AfsR/SARP family transcriptional regulator [Micromonospora andamanensis]GIJ12294.1 hypothetical protein Van01_55080 [Micromonospora andamanensis]